MAQENNAAEATCQCSEGFIDVLDETGRKIGQRRTGIKAHDCDYILARNALIPEAERISTAYKDPFGKAMDRLAKERIFGRSET